MRRSVRFESGNVGQSERRVSSIRRRWASSFLSNEADTVTVPSIYLACAPRLELRALSTEFAP